MTEEEYRKIFMSHMAEIQKENNQLREVNSELSWGLRYVLAAVKNDADLVSIKTIAEDALAKTIGRCQ